MQVKKVLRYYADCGRGFWKKQKAISHDKNCVCWTNPALKCCLSCKHKNFITDSNGMENEPQYLQTWQENQCKYSESGAPVHEGLDHIRKYCSYYESKTSNT